MITGRSSETSERYVRRPTPGRPKTTPAADQDTQVEAEERHEGDHRRAQHVPQKDTSGGQSLGPGRSDEVLVLNLDQVRAEHARIEADVEDRQRDPRDEQVQEPLPRVLG